MSLQRAREIVAAFVGQDDEKARDIIMAAADLYAQLVSPHATYVELTQRANHHKNRAFTGRTYRPGQGALR